MSNAPETITAVSNRFDDLFLGLKVSDIELKMQDQSDEEKRTLLDVEKRALRDKELNKKHQQNFLKDLQEKLNEEIELRLNLQLENFDFLQHLTLSPQGEIAPILDTLSVKAASIGRLEPQVDQVTWLRDDLMKMINSNKYRKPDKKGQLRPVDNLKVALSYFGIENLKLLVPALSFKRLIPQITDPFPKIKTQLWEHALGTALAAKKIAELTEDDANNPYLLSMYHLLGTITIIRLYFRLFDDVQRDALLEAHEARLKEEHAVLNSVEPSSEFLLQLINTHAFGISVQLIESLGFKRVFILNAMKELAENTPDEQMSPIARIVSQAKLYSKYRMLKGNNLITLDEAKPFLMQTKFPDKALATLKTTDLRRLNLSVDQE